MRDSKFAMFYFWLTAISLTAILGSTFMMFGIAIWEAGIKEAFWYSFGSAFVVSCLFGALVYTDFEEIKKLLIKSERYMQKSNGDLIVGHKRKLGTIELLLFIIIFVEVVYIDVVGQLAVLVTMASLFYVTGVSSMLLKDLENASIENGPRNEWNELISEEGGDEVPKVQEESQT